MLTDLLTFYDLFDSTVRARNKQEAKRRKVTWSPSFESFSSMSSRGATGRGFGGGVISEVCPVDVVCFSMFFAKVVFIRCELAQTFQELRSTWAALGALAHCASDANLCEDLDWQNVDPGSRSQWQHRKFESQDSGGGKYPTWATETFSFGAATWRWTNVGRLQHSKRFRIEIRN